MKQNKIKGSKIVKVAHNCIVGITISTDVQSQKILKERLVQSFEAVEHTVVCATYNAQLATMSRG